MPGTHSLISPSGVYRVLNCPQSLLLEKQFPKTESTYAAKGTLAHALAELKLRKRFSAMPDAEYRKELDGIKADPLYQPEMDAYTDMYIDYIFSICLAFPSEPYTVAEKRLDISFIALEMSGTADCIVLWGDTLHIIDLKYGKGVPVSAENNPQLRLYALGAVYEYGLFADIQTVHMHIVQPRLDSTSSETLTVAEVRAWGESIKPTLNAALRGEGGFHAGDWCRFCRAKAQCRAPAETLLMLEEPKQRQEAGETLTNEEIGEILTRIRLLKPWADAVEEYAEKQMLTGNTIPGWKLVEGTSRRTILNYPEAVEKLQAAGFDEALLYERKPLGTTALDKLAGGQKKLKELLGDSIVKPPGKPTLVPESDKRKPISEKRLSEMFPDSRA